MRAVLFASAQARKLTYYRSSLATAGYEMTPARTSAQFWGSLMRRPIDAIVLDASAGDGQLDPWRLITELSALNHLPLIVLIRGGRNQDRVRAFQSGAHHCLTLPVTPVELQACLAAAFASGRDRPARGDGDVNDFYADPDLQIDFANRQIRRQGRVFPLTARECPVLLHLIDRAGNMVPSQELCKSGWGDRAWPAKRNALKTYIMQLRRKIERDARRPRYIVSQRGMGYAFMPRRVRKVDGVGA